LSINKDLVIIQHIDKFKQLPKLKVLKIVDVKMTKQEANILKTALSPDTKVIVSIPEYLRFLGKIIAFRNALLESQ
jgi:hypothetical protein